MIDARDNWRILLLVSLCLLAGLALFGPFGPGAEDDAPGSARQVSDATNLQYGLELAGGTRIRAQLVGMTAELDANVQGEEREITGTVAEELGVDGIDVRVQQADAETATVEVFSENVTEEEFVAALETADLGASTDDVRRGVTEETRDRAVRTLEDRINEAGLSGGSVSIATTASGDHFVIIEVPGVDREELRELIGDPGRVQIVAGRPVPTTDGDTVYAEDAVLTMDDIQGIGLAETGGGGEPPHVPVTLTEEAGERFQQDMNEMGFTGEGVGRCQWRSNPDEPGWCLYTVLDDEKTFGASMSPGLAETIAAGEFSSNPTFQMQTVNFSEAQQLEINLRAGALPTALDIQTETFLAPSLAQSFKLLALLTALGAWLGVSAVVYYWYRDVRVAVPMLVTASAEVFLLLGFAAAVGLPLDLAHIAGLIAVIGTGLDDLIIMADEILQRRQDVKTGRVFQNRFRKAFWVIGMAAATTIIAMSPLAVLSLGDLRGFAIVTIVGVVIGVAVTRPAYGDVLRHLMLEDVKRTEK